MDSGAIPVEQLMSTDLVTIASDAAAETAAKTLLEEGVGSLIVFHGDGELAGVITSTDLVEIVSAGGAGADAPVGDYMTTSVVTVRATDSIHDAAVRMMREDVQHLPVTDGEGDVVGMLSATDLTGRMTHVLNRGTD